MAAPIQLPVEPFVEPNYSFDTGAFTETFANPSNYSFKDSDFSGAYGNLGGFDSFSKAATGGTVGTGGTTGTTGTGSPSQPATIMDYLEAFGIPFAKSFGTNVGTGLAMRLFPGLQGSASPFKPMTPGGKTKIAGTNAALNERLDKVRKEREALESGIIDGGDGMFASTKPEIDIFNAGERAYQGMRA